VAASTLLIDDETGFVESVAASFEARDLLLDVASSWESGLALYRAGLHELVVADYNLPGSKHGLKLLLEVKALRPSSRLVLISGRVTPTAADLIAAAGLVDRFIPKTTDMARELIDEGREAERRSMQDTDWRHVAGAHLARSSIDEAALEAVDAALRVQVES
jgi:ActR/RegA family two-component response regulator